MKIFSDSEISFSKHYLNCYQILWPLNFLFLDYLARLTRISDPSADSETSLKVMRYWKFSQKTKLKQKIFTDSEKEVGNFFKTGTIVDIQNCYSHFSHSSLNYILVLRLFSVF